jgi:outer membrane protein OmpA-like peptidoglycan-associated protein
VAPRLFEEARTALVEAERLAARRQFGRQLQLAVRTSLTASNKVLKTARIEAAAEVEDELAELGADVVEPVPEPALEPAAVGPSLLEQFLSAFALLGETRTDERGLTLVLPDALFDIERATLRPEAGLLLAKLAGMLLLIPQLGLQVEGHTDSSEEAGYSMEFSRERAQSVARFMQEQGVEVGRLASAGYGLERPIADNRTYEGRKRNRRVELVVTGVDR